MKKIRLTIISLVLISACILFGFSTAFADDRNRYGFEYLQDSEDYEEVVALLPSLERWMTMVLEFEGCPPLKDGNQFDIGNAVKFYWGSGVFETNTNDRETIENLFAPVHSHGWIYTFMHEGVGYEVTITRGITREELVELKKKSIEEMFIDGSITETGLKSLDENAGKWSIVGVSEGGATRIDELVQKTIEGSALEKDIDRVFIVEDLLMMRGIFVLTASEKTIDYLFNFGAYTPDNYYFTGTKEEIDAVTAEKREGYDRFYHFSKISQAALVSYQEALEAYEKTGEALIGGDSIQLLAPDLYTSSVGTEPKGLSSNLCKFLKYIFSPPNRVRIALLFVYSPRYSYLRNRSRTRSSVSN